MNIFFKYQRLTTLWALFVLIMCNVDLGGVGKSSLFFPGFDKLAHSGFFFVLVVFSANGFMRQHGVGNLSYKKAFIITLLGILFGAFIEILQLTIITWRTGDWDDLFADTVGACMGIFSILVTIDAVKRDVKK